jgi:hypothetical protein
MFYFSFRFVKAEEVYQSIIEKDESVFLNATFSNISVISWRPVLVEEEATGKLYHLRLRVECTLFCNLQSWVRTHAVLVIGLYELLSNPTTDFDGTPDTELPVSVYTTKTPIDMCHCNVRSST